MEKVAEKVVRLRKEEDEALAHERAREDADLVIQAEAERLLGPPIIFCPRIQYPHLDTPDVQTPDEVLFSVAATEPLGK